MRRHAGSWLIKVVFSIIILTFIFFFGYTKFASRLQDERNYIAVVGDVGISRRKFDESFQAAMERMKEGLKGEVPEALTAYLRQNVVEQLISRELFAQYALSIGLQVSDEEIAGQIRADKNLFPDGNFDLALYEQKFLPYYRQRFGEDYEAVVERQLLIDKVQTLLPILFDPWQSEVDIPPAELFSPWMETFREKEAKIEIY